MRRLPVFLTVFLIVLFCFAAKCFSQEGFTFNKTKIKQGSFLAIYGVGNFYVEMEDQQFKPRSYKKNQLALIGIGIDTKIGEYDAKIYGGPDNQLLFSKKIRVIGRKRGKIEKIKVKKKFNRKKIKKDRKQNARATSASAPDFLFSGFGFPIKIEPVKITSHFGVWRKRRFHLGTDFRVRLGDGKFASVHAIAGGVVIVNNFQEANGGTVIIDHGAGIFSYYLHLSELKNREKTRRKVKMGEVVGVGGSTGYAVGPHLHLGLRIPGIMTKKGKLAPSPTVIDPIEFIEFFKELN